MDRSSVSALSFLSEDVRARTRVLNDGPPKKRPYVLYWMRVAVRDHENPALDAAISAANALDAIVLVYHALSERYPFASDRHHTFILEGARDVACGLRRRGIAYALHVERPGARGPMLRMLAEEAALVLEGVSTPLSERVRDVPFDPCIALGFVADHEALLSAPFDGLFVGRDGDPNRVLTWVARDSSKPMRSDSQVWVVQAAAEWSSAHFRDPPEQIERLLLDDLARVLGMGAIRARASTLQRWRFARSPSPLESPLFDDEGRIGIGGDWTAGGRVEGAFLSGVALAGRVLGLPEPA